MSHAEISFSAAEQSRYHRHLILPGFGMEGQQKLKAARVLVVGAGGLGSPLLLYLAAAGVGHIGIVDFDRVDDSNLQRQVLFGVEDVGRSKTAAAKQRLEALNPHVGITLHSEKLTADNALKILGLYDVVADGSDNFPTRYLVNDACVLLGKPNVYGAVSRFDGQVSVFSYRDAQGEVGPDYRDLYPDPPPPDVTPNCEEGGVLGVLPGIIGSFQALEVIKIISGIGEPLSGRMLLFDGLSFTTHIFRIPKRADNPVSGKRPTLNGLIDYEAFCNVRNIREINAAELKQWQARNEVFQLIDVREPEEYAAGNLGGELLPLASLMEAESRISRQLKVVVYCKSGSRSARAIRQLEEHLGLSNLYNLQGGIDAYRAFISDTSG